MNAILFPKHVTERLERRWAARLARDAATWRSEWPSVANADAITDRKGRIVPVTRKLVPLKAPELSRVL